MNGTTSMVGPLRILLRDKGHKVWETNEELQGYLDEALGLWNEASPKTNIKSVQELAQSYPVWRAPVLQKAWVIATSDQTAIERLSDQTLEKYRLLGEAYQEEFDRAVGRKALQLERLGHGEPAPPSPSPG